MKRRALFGNLRLTLEVLKDKVEKKNTIFLQQMKSVPHRSIAVIILLILHPFLNGLSIFFSFLSSTNLLWFNRFEIAEILSPSKSKHTAGSVVHLRGRHSDAINTFEALNIID